MNLPGSVITIKPLDNNIQCEGYNCDCNNLAVKRVQGETDSFGAEYFYYCHECYDKMKVDQDKIDAEPEVCNWCKETAILHPERNWEEGLNGPVYYICDKCSSKQHKDMMEELEYLEQ